MSIRGEPIISGSRSGRLVALETTSARTVRCRCDCGTEKEILRSNFRSQLSRSCGCQHGKKLRKPAALGSKYGRLVLVEDVTPAKGRTTFRCKCDCGRETVATLKAMKVGNTLSCGCIRIEKLLTRRKPMARRSAEAGKRYGKLTILGDSPYTGSVRRVICACECGATKSVSLYGVRFGSIKSCGCIRGHAPLGGVPGLRKRFYRRWHLIMARCYVPGRSDYDKYGAKGIRVCDRWHQFSAFAEDMWNSFVEHVTAHGLRNTTIDRYPISTGDYTQDNTRWATWEQQQRNRVIAHRLEFEGKNLCIAEWAEERGLPQGTISKRLKAGWSIEKTLTTPRMNRGLRPRAVTEKAPICDTASGGSAG